MNKNVIIDDNDIYRLIDNSANTVYRTVVSNAVMRHFRSAHLVATKYIIDGVIATLAFGNEPTIDLVDKILKCLRRRNTTIYATVDSAYIPIEQVFIEYAKKVIDYPTVKSLDIRNTNFIIYTLSCDIYKNESISKMELFYNTFNFSEIKTIKRKYLLDF